MPHDLRELIKVDYLSGYIKEELAICKRCAGKGSTEHREMVDYHHREYEITHKPCDECNSTGRVYKQTLSLEGFRPFKEV